MKHNKKTNFLVLTLIVFTVFFISCEDSDYGSDADSTGMLITVADSSIASAGYGQYRLKTLSGENVPIKLDLSGLGPLSALSVFKSVNTVADTSFGVEGNMDISVVGVSNEYVFNYLTKVEDIDELVGLSFTAEEKSGKTVTSDLTLLVTLSPRDNITRKKWAWTSKVWVDGGNIPDLKDCETDNYYLFNADSTLSVDYGDDTADGDCAFDGFTIYEKWYLTEDEKWFILQTSGLFDPTVVIDSYRVETLTTEQLELSIDLDLSFFGLGTEETFQYGYTAEPL